MNTTSNTQPAQTIKEWMERNLDEIIQRIAVRSRQELSDYRNRGQEDLLEAIRSGVLSWYESITNKDFAYSRQNSERVVKNNMDQGRDVEQILRTPVILCETVLQRLSETGQNTDPTERAAFIREAQRHTDQIIKIGRLQVANYAINKATTEHKRELEKKPKTSRS